MINIERGRMLTTIKNVLHKSHTVRKVSIIINIVIVLYSVISQANTWQPSPGYKQIPIWPEDKMPNALSDTKPESLIKKAIFNVSKPTMTIYSPKTKNTGVAIVVFPGGGFNGLAIGIEGTEVCDWLVTRGITCVLLKYRVPDSGPAWHNDCNCYIHPKAPTALQDAQRTMGLLRINASKWGINPNKIGVLGFSAGGYMVPHLSTHFKNAHTLQLMRLIKKVVVQILPLHFIRVICRGKTTNLC